MTTTRQEVRIIGAFFIGFLIGWLLVLALLWWAYTARPGFPPVNRPRIEAEIEHPQDNDPGAAVIPRIEGDGIERAFALTRVVYLYQGRRA